MDKHAWLKRVRYPESLCPRCIFCAQTLFSQDVTGKEVLTLIKVGYAVDVIGVGSVVDLCSGVNKHQVVRAGVSSIWRHFHLFSINMYTTRRHLVTPQEHIFSPLFYLQSTSIYYIYVPIHVNTVHTRLVHFIRKKKTQSTRKHFRVTSLILLVLLIHEGV